MINVCKEHLPNMAKGYSSPKLTQYIGDGFEYMRQHENEFDVVITDSSDPVGMYHNHHHHCHIIVFVIPLFGSRKGHAYDQISIVQNCDKFYISC